MDNYTPRLKTLYRDEVAGQLKEQFSYDNVMEIPRLTKIVINKGVGEAVANKKALQNAVDELRAITGQHPVTRQARKSVSNFKLRQGMPVTVVVEE